MKKSISLLFVVIVLLSSCTQNNMTNTRVSRPKLVIGIVVDQMRWDYLYRYYDRYGSDGFKRLLNDGFSCQNTMINYLPAFTAPGHACVYTGSVPSIHGIVGNDWIDNQTGKNWYCVDDSTVHMKADDRNLPPMSPRTLLTTTITDELRLATNLGSRVYSVAIKDRGSILPGGHLANAAYWYNDRTGNFTSSSYYPNASPKWLDAFNKRRVGDSLMKQNWKLLYAANSYKQSTTDATTYEKEFKGEKAPVFPHVFDTLADTDKYVILKTLPAGNTYTVSMAKACIEGEDLGTKDNTDFLCISFSSTDYAGHQFAPNSVEMEDMFLRLDIEIASFLKYLDGRVGKDNYLLFLTADHGAAHNTAFLNDLDVPAGLPASYMADDLVKMLQSKYNAGKLIDNILNYQVYLNEGAIEKANLDRNAVKASICQWFNKRPEVQYTIDLENKDKTMLPEPIQTMIVNGYYRLRSGDIQIVFNPGWFDNKKPQGTSHGTWNPYDTHIPLLWYGWHITHGESFSPVHMTDITPTLAALLHIQMPNGCIGNVIREVASK